MSKGSRTRAGRTRDDLMKRRRLVRLVYFASRTPGPTRSDAVAKGPDGFPARNRHERRKFARLSRI